MSDMGFASSVIGISIKMLREKYTDSEIIKILSRKNIKGALAIIDRED